MRYTTRPCCCVVVFALIAGLLALASQTAGASVSPPPDPFSSYTGSAPLAGITPGSVLDSRTVTYGGYGYPVQVVQLLYRSTGALGQPTTNVTSVLEPPVSTSPARAVSYQSYYDSLKPQDEPSVQFAGGTSPGGTIGGEGVFIAPLLLEGITVIVPDTEGQTADLASGAEYGMNTLDSIRAATSTPQTGLNKDTKVGLLGYSGGGLATDWAAQLAPTYAPDANRQLVGAAEGGLEVDLAHIVQYVSGSQIYSGLIPAGLIGITRAYHIDLAPYLSAYGLQLYNSLQDASLSDITGHYPGLTISQLLKPQYANPDSIPAYVQTVNKLNLGSVGSPTIPVFIGEGANGILEGTSPGPPGIGPGDGATVTGDVRSLARQFCTSGTQVSYIEYDALSHILTGAAWAIPAVAWLNARLLGLPAPNDCSTIPPGNSLAPEQPAP